MASAQDGTVASNLGVDYVIHYKVPPKERAEAEAGFVQLVTALTRAGLATEVRNADRNSLFVFVRIASADLLNQQVYRSRLQDWLHNVRSSGPDKDISQSIKEDPVTEAERLRLVYQMISKDENEGGAGVMEARGKWKYVDAIFPLHNREFNKAWIKKWNSKYILEESDLEEIRDKFGESVAFYFVFLRSYFRFLVIPSALGFAAWTLLGQFSTVYAFASTLWSVVFFEYWKKKEVDLAVQWGVRNVSKIQRARTEYQWDYEIEDVVTGEPVKVYSPLKRLQTQALQIPFALACVAVLGGLVLTANSLEIFINQVYDGPGKQYLGFLPTVILVIFTPVLSTILMNAAKALTEMENYATVDAYESALVQKQFVLNFMTSYMPLLFTAFIYIPFGEFLMPVLEFWRRTAMSVTLNKVALPTKKFEVNPERISSQMFYFTVTAQIVNFATELVVPYIKSRAFAKAKEYQSRGKSQVIKDNEEEVEFLTHVREQYDMEAYDVTADYREMIMQFGYLSLFSVAWPLAGCCFFINNWIELRSDAMKIATSSRRPIPWRADSIGPWLPTIGLLSWLGSVTSSAIVYLCSGEKQGARGTSSYFTAWGLLSSILLAEHFYFLAQFVVRFVMSNFESPGLQKERKERYLMKKSLLKDQLGQEAAEKASATGIEMAEKITRQALEEEARQGSIRGQSSPSEVFWQRQRGLQETVQVGRRMIELQSSAASGKSNNPPAPSPSA